MDIRHALPVVLLTLVCVGCRQDGPASLENRGPLFSARQAAGTARVVDDDGADCPDAGFASIQAAVDAAAPGDRVLVCDGTYHEEVTVAKRDLRIVAANEPPQVILDAHGHEFGFRVVGASGVTIQGFHVQHAHEADIQLQGTSFTTVNHNVTTGAGHDGIQLVDADDNIIEHNSAMDNLAANACGINVAGGSERNVVRHNRLANNEWGIQISGAATRDNVISTNMSLGNRGNGIRNIGGASGTIIERNHVRSNGLAPGALTGATAAGIRLASGTGIMVRENHAFDNRLVDLLRESAAAAAFDDNRCETSSPEGLCERGRP